MKIKTNICCFHIKQLLSALILIFVVAVANKLAGQTINHANVINGSDRSIIIAIKALNDNKTGSGPNYRNASMEWEGRRNQTITELLNILNNTKSDILAKCCAARCLGVMHASKAVDGLAAQISISPPPPAGSDLSGGLSCGYEPAAEALVAIGVASVPAVIRNLAENDNTKVRELSLQVLIRIYGDKDISQLRLQKALKSEKDAQKQVRLQAALKSIS